jgi:hypothetical protein
MDDDWKMKPSSNNQMTFGTMVILIFRIGSLLCLLTNIVEILQNNLIKDCMVLQDWPSVSQLIQRD